MYNTSIDKLNNKQLEAVDSVNGPVLVTAGAGSGKTSVLTNRIANILKNKLCYEDNILAITFTNKAANEMRERVDELIGLNNNNLWIMTFHSMCVRMLRENNNIAKINGYSKDFTIYDTSDRDRVLKKIILDNNISEKDYHKKISYHLSSMKNDNLSYKDYSEKLSMFYGADKVLKVIQEYEKVLTNNNALDFDSLLTTAYNLLAHNKEILNHYTNKFKYIHVDEFQDTNIVQYDLVRLLGNKHKNIFVVGDEDQCIYTWRGAKSSHIFNFLSDFKNAKQIKLEQNYRSTKNIINLANRIIKNNPERLDKNLWTSNFEGSKVNYYICYNEKEEAKYVAEQIYLLRQSKNIQYSDIAILMRLNSLSRNFEDKFIEFGIPYKVLGGMKFYDRLEVKNLLAYLKLIVNPRDDASFTRVINFPKRSIGDSAIKELLLYRKPGESLLETVLSFNEETELKPSILKKYLNFKKLFISLLELKEKTSISEFIKNLVKEISLFEYYNTGKEEDETRAYNIDEFIKSVQDYEKDNPEKLLDEYLQSVSLISDIDTYNDNEESVTLGTIHSVKGLEFDNIFVIGCEENILPLKRSDTTESDYQEERRLMYVSITRAKKELYITSCKTRHLYGSNQYMNPSKFLTEGELIPNNKDNIFLKTDNQLDSLSTYKNNSNYYAKKNISQEIITKTHKVNSKKIIQSIKVNDKVEHPKFGIGIILGLSGTDETKTAKVAFENIGTKILALNYAPLKILE